MGYEKLPCTSDHNRKLDTKTVQTLGKVIKLKKNESLTFLENYSPPNRRSQIQSKKLVEVSFPTKGLRTVFLTQQAMALRNFLILCLFLQTRNLVQLRASERSLIVRIYFCPSKVQNKSPHLIVFLL